MRTDPSAPAAEVAAPAGGEDRLSRSCRRTLAVAAGLAALFVFLSIVMAFPSIHSWRAATPGDYGDSFLQQWLLKWDVRGLFADGESVFSPNIYYPFRNTLLYTDTGLATAPVSAVLGRFVSVTILFNLVYLSGWVFSLASTYALARWLGASRVASILAGIVFSFAAVRLGHHGHFQLGFSYFVPLTIYLLLRFLEERRWWQALTLGAACAAAFLNAAYIAVMLAPTLAAIGLGWLIATRFRPGPRFVRGSLLAAGVTLVLILPVLQSYRLLGNELHRGYHHQTAITFKNFLSPAAGSLIYGWLERAVKSEFENQLFPGFLAAGIGGYGGYALWKGRRRQQGDETHPAPQPDLRRRGLLLVLAASPIALLLAFGKYQYVFGWKVTLPYSWVADLPGFASIRAFGRFTVVPLLALALLVAVGYDRLVAARPRRTALVVGAVIGSLMLLEYNARITVAPHLNHRQYTTVNHALADLPDGVVLELPMGDSRNYKWAYTEAPRMVLSTIDWKDRVNGYSGYSVPGYEKTIDAANSLDDGGPATAAALELLDRLGIRYLVIRMAPLDQTWADLGISYWDEAGANRIIQALPPERVEGVSEEGAAMLVRLRPAG